MFDLTPEEARLLLNVALMAVGRNRFRSAAAILAALERFRPNHPSIAEAKMVALMSAGDFLAAVTYADGDGSRNFPNSAMLQAFKGMALIRLDRKSEARDVLSAVAAQDGNPAAARMAQDLLKG